MATTTPELHEEPQPEGATLEDRSGSMPAGFEGKGGGTDAAAAERGDEGRFTAGWCLVSTLERWRELG
jgi:hypothetical protein